MTPLTHTLIIILSLLGAAAFLAIALKWIFFILLWPITYHISRPRAPKPAGGSSSANELPAIEKSNSLRSNILHYVHGYLRYMDICVAIPSHRIRRFIYTHFFRVKLAPKSVIYYGAEIRSHGNLTVGQGSIIGDKVVLDARNGITIGDNVNFSSEVQIWTEQHDHRDPLFRCQSDASYRVDIADRAWIGPRVIILHSVSIGEGAVVAAGAVVTKDVPPFAIVAGVPAKVIGQRNRDLQYVLDGKYLPFL